MKNRTRTNLSGLFIFLLLVGILGGMTSCAPKQEEKSKDVSLPEIVPMEYSIRVDFGDSVAKYTALPVLGEISVYEAMVAAGKEGGGFSFEDSEFPGMGKFIIAINKVNQNPDEKKYWQLCIDGKMVNAGVEELTISGGEEIQWYYGEKTPCSEVGD